MCFVLEDRSDPSLRLGILEKSLFHRIYLCPLQPVREIDVA